MIKPQFTEKQSSIVASLVDKLSQVNGVVAIAIGGSFACGIATPSSDIDIGLYYYDDNPFNIGDIRTIAEDVNDEPNPTVADFGGWGKWVNGGAWLTINGQRVDFLYRSIDSLKHWIEQSKNGVIELDYYQQPATGFYSYIYLGELNICIPLLDESQQLHNLKEQILIYPPKLKAKIIKDFSWMAEFSLYHAETAAKRDDIYMLVGCVHRILAAIVQIIYAKNEHYFISDKGAIAECMTFKQVSPDFETTVTDILSRPSLRAVNQLGELLTRVIE